jgi:hypothetical protein
LPVCRDNRHCGRRGIATADRDLNEIKRLRVGIW